MAVRIGRTLDGILGSGEATRPASAVAAAGPSVDEDAAIHARLAALGYVH